MAVKGEFDKAIADCTKAIRLKPDYAAAYATRAVAHTAKGALDEAIVDYSKAIRLKPDDGRAYLRRSSDYDRKGEAAKAEADRQRARGLGFMADSLELY